MFKNTGKEMGASLGESIEKSVKELKELKKETGSLERTAEILKEAALQTAYIVMGGIVINTLIKKL